MSFQTREIDEQYQHARLDTRYLPSVPRDLVHNIICVDSPASMAILLALLLDWLMAKQMVPCSDFVKEID